MPPTVQGLLALIWRQSWVRLLCYIGLVLLAVYAGRLLASVVVTALLAYAIAYLVNPLLNWLQSRRVPRVVGVVLFVVVLLAVVALLFWTVLSQVINLISDLPKLSERFLSFTDDALDRLSGVQGLQNVREQLTTYVNTQVQTLTKNLGPIAQRLLASGGSVLSSVASVTGWLGQAGFVITLSLYFMLDFQRVGPSVLRLFPRGWQPTVTTLSSDVAVAFGHYIRGQILIGLAVGALVAIGLTILGIPNAVAIGLLAALLDIVPYLGPVISAVPAVLLALPDGWLKVALVILVFVVANQIEGNLLSPYILGRTTNLSSAAILLAILAGLTLGGLVGALLAVPVAILLKRWTEKYWMTSRAHQNEPQ